MPSHPLRGVVSVVTRDPLWNSNEKPPSIWGFSLTGKEVNFPASKFEAFEYLQSTELPSDIRMSMPKLGPERSVLALTKIQT
jgi:hypothetical protein